MQYVKNFIISAAGLGTRLGLDIPKCLLKIHDIYLIDALLSCIPPESNIRIVVGFKEKLVIDHVRKKRQDVTFVRNPHFSSTSNAYSLYLALNDLKDPTIMIDGDLLISPSSFQAFLEFVACQSASVIGVTKRKSEDAIGVKIDDNDEIIEFLTKKDAGYDACYYEWAGVAYLYNISVLPNENYIFQSLSKSLPLKFFEIDCFEIDTASDYEMVNRQIRLT